MLSVINGMESAWEVLVPSSASDCALLFPG